MNCIQLPSPPLIPLHSELKHQQLLRQNKLPCLTSISLTSTVPQTQHFPSPRSVRTKALPHSIVIAASSSPKSVDMSVLLQTSALLLVVYFIANFIVPELISKYFGFDKVDKDQKVDDVKCY